jgi:serine/threonine protein kinase/Tol biopolymer transport system component
MGSGERLAARGTLTERCGMTPERWARIKEVFNAALERDEGKRADFVATTCGPDAELRRELERLLREHSLTPDLESPVKPQDLVGRTVSHYHILEKLGQGGMGEVYKAEDTRLGRQVALKFLPEELAKDRQTLERFKLEARAASALNHPNICTIYDIDQHDGQPFIAMELLEGQTLKQRIGVAAVHEPSLPVDQLLDLGIQMADALEAAHAKGIIHRDIKPANIFVIPRGASVQAKIVDFGLAKLTRSTAVPAGATGEMPVLQGALTASTETDSLSSPGMVMGTVAYMSPEQARGEDVDARTDLFSFGAVLYEMATGERAFPGTATAVVFNAILSGAPGSAFGLSPHLPRELERIIGKAMEKERDLRYQTASELRADLTRLKHDREAGRAAVGPVEAVRELLLPTVRWPLVPAGILAVAVVGLSIVWFATHRAPPPPPQLTERRLTANPSENPVTQGAISPDGKYLAYGDRGGLHLKLIQTGETIAIPQPEGPAPDRAAWWPNGWFPDSTRFVVAGIAPDQRPSAWIVSVMAGAPRKLRDDADPWSVSPDGALIAFGSGASFFRFREIWVMGAHGEQPHRLISGSEDDGFFWTAWSPDGRRIAYARFHRTPERLECSIESRELKGGQPTLILSDPRLCVGNTKFLWFPNGRLIYTMLEPEPRQGDNNLWEIRVDTSTGRPESAPRRLTNWFGATAQHLSGTQDGKQLAISRGSKQADVYVAELAAGGHRLKTARRLTLNESNDFPGRWMPDSKALLFVSDRNGRWDIFKQALDQTDAQRVVTGPDAKRDPVLSPDGSWILYLSSGTGQVGAGTPVRIMRVPTSGGAPQLVMEGRGISSLACARSPTTLCALSEPSPDLKQLVISALDPLNGRGKELTRISLWYPNNYYSWDISRDGSRLAFTQSSNREGRIRILSLAGGENREIDVKGWNYLRSLSWATDGKGLFVGRRPISGSTLLYVDLEGRSDVLWQQGELPGSPWTWGAPSPDGRHLAFVSYSADTNVWMLENF